jgi:hypothetical protein
MERAKRLATAVALAPCLLASACASVQVGVTYDTTVDFSKYRTFAFRADRTLDDEFRQRLAERVITRHLTAKGLRLNPEAPDLLIGMRPDFDNASGPHAAAAGRVVWRTWGPYDGLALSTGSAEFRDATLALNISESGGRPVWRGAAQARIEAGNPAQTEAKLEEALDRLLSRFPPPPE